MSETVAAQLERECVVVALRGHRTCPVYRMPCWVCRVLHLLTGTLRSVSGGRFDRFLNKHVNWGVADGSELARLWDEYAESPTTLCVHHTGMIEFYGSYSYWNSEEASEVTS